MNGSGDRPAGPPARARALAAGIVIAAAAFGGLVAAADPPALGSPGRPTTAAPTTPTATPAAGTGTGTGEVRAAELGESVRALDVEGAVRAIELADSVRPLMTEERGAGAVAVTINTDVLFAFDSDELTDVARREINRIAGQVGASTESVSVEGHTDSLGTPAYNVILSQRRANAVAGLLRPAVPSGTRVSATGRGGADPVAPETRPDGSDDPDGRALNRRVEIRYRTG